MEQSHFHWKTPTTLVVTIRVVPGAQKTAFSDVKDGAIRMLLQAQPKDNEANDALIKFLSKTFKTPQANISIISGEKSRQKIVSIESPRKIPEMFLNMPREP